MGFGLTNNCSLNIFRRSFSMTLCIARSKEVKSRSRERFLADRLCCSLDSELVDAAPGVSLSTVRSRANSGVSRHSKGEM